jgi:hypothetical protein
MAAAEPRSDVVPAVAHVVVVVVVVAVSGGVSAQRSLSPFPATKERTRNIFLVSA